MARASHIAALAGYLKDAWTLNGSYEAPSYGRPYRSPMWEFVRRAKAHAELERLDAYDAAALAESCMETWNEAKGDDDLWQTYFPASEDAKAEFIHTWERVKWPRATLDQALPEAAALPLNPKRCCSPKYGKFVSLAGHLQRAVDGPILLPCAKIAALLVCEPMTITRYRNLAQSEVF
jgi:hypothetical protein